MENFEKNDVIDIFCNDKLITQATVVSFDKEKQVVSLKNDRKDTFIMLGFNEKTKAWHVVFKRSPGKRNDMFPFSLVKKE